jgi:hypothetical protein
MACFWGLVAGLAAAAAGGTSRHRLGLARGSSVVVLSGPGSVQAGVRKCSHRAGRPAAVSAPICPAGRNIHRRTARSRPGHCRSRSTVAAGRNERRSQPAAGAGPAVLLPLLGVVVVLLLLLVGHGGGIGSQPQSRPIVKLGTCRGLRVSIGGCVVYTQYYEEKHSHTR